MHKGISGCSGLDVKKKNDSVDCSASSVEDRILRALGDGNPRPFCSFHRSALIQIVAVSQAAARNKEF